ncbi:MAG TPA: AmmeMemoRadiSam system protein A [Usitatibacter sp.]|nr:AmmeMemoRadiSam system protein A [Usitatibacter sp.]
MSANPKPEDARGSTLIAIAREAIVRGDESPVLSGEDWLRAPGASFVTLRLDGELRGCIGSVQARRALGEDVAHNARAAAFRDPRFPPVPAVEIPRLQVEVSVLSPREHLQVYSEAEALQKLRPGIDGVYFEFHDLASTFLPQVWESLPDPVDFLGELRRKAGLPPKFWHPDVRLSRYTVEKFT